MNKLTLNSLLGVVLSLLPINKIKAQILPDQTLHQETSIVTPINSNNNRIDGGAVRGANLFHSFQEFNIDRGSSVYFSNPAGIDNILTRVTGNNSSSILGKLGVLGNANFWLINPNGIYFGTDASLDIKGSFIATTNDKIKLGDHIYFGTKSTNLPNNQLLTIQPSALFNNSINNKLAAINNQGNLKVGTNQNLIFFGGDVINTGKLTSPGGSVYLLGENISLLDHATIDVSSSLGGGQVFIGGGFQGKGTIPTAKTTYIGKDVNIKADALADPNSQFIGNGGNIAIWSDQNTTFYGNISARGVNNNLATFNSNYQNQSITQNISHGGFVEVSSKQNLIFRGYVNTSSPSGNPGTLLIDPENITIAKGSGTDNETTIYQDNLEALSGENNLILEANNNITLEDLNNGVLTLAPGQGKIAFIADADGNGIGNFTMENTANTIKTNGRDILISGSNLTLGNIDTSFIINSSTKIIDIDNGGVIGEINNPNPANFTFTVPDDVGTTINQLNVRLSAAHTYVGDLTVYLTSPQGTRVTLFDGVGEDGDNFQNTLLSDNAIQNIRDAQPPFSGTYQPDNRIYNDKPLENFNNQNPTGTWTLQVIDNFIGEDSGILYKEGETTTWEQNAIGTQLIFSTNLPTVAPSGVINLSATNGNVQAGNLNTNNAADSTMNAASLIRASGNIELNSYQGSSLHLRSGGGVNINGDINIVGVDQNHFIQETVNLSDQKTTVNINSNNQTTLDIRSGTTNFNAGIYGFENNIIPIVSTTTNSFINIHGNIYNFGGLVLLSNQNQPQKSLNGDITTERILTNSDISNGGSIFIDSQGEINLNNQINTFSLKNGGSITFFANDNITLKHSVNTQGLNGGHINFISHNHIFLQGISTDNPDILFNFNLTNFGKIKSGDVQLMADKGININFFNILSNNTFGEGGLSGNITLASQGDIALKSSLINNNVDNGNPGEKGGDININARSFIASDNSLIQSRTFGNVNAGNVNIQAAEKVNFSNKSQVLNDSTDDFTTAGQFAGNAGDINITAQDVNFVNNSQLTTRTYGTGNAGDVHINASLISFDINGAILAENINGSGKGGNIQIFTDNLLLNNESSFAASTSGSGEAGNIEITTGNLHLAGKGKLRVETSGTGDAGNIEISTKNLNIVDGAEISASTTGAGKGGNINVYANTLTANNGAQFLTTTSGMGKAGNINLQVRDNITLDGTDTGFFANTDKGSIGDGGSINIDPQTFIIKNGAGIGVNSQGSGKGGNISIQAGTLSIENQGFISAETFSTQGGEINLKINDLLLLRNNSRITATAGTQNAGGDGGNININAPFIVVFPNENNDITANAYQGNGGKINITTKAIFGLKYRPQLTEKSDITASSQFGLSGEVEINTPDVDPTSGLIELPKNLVDAESLLGKNLCSNEQIAKNSSFTITGKGGLPAEADDLISNSPGLVEWANRSSKQETTPAVRKQKEINQEQVNIDNPVIKQAQGWIITADGRVILTAEAPNITPQSMGLIHPGCH
jgi:filamentous hemagglutinin family protein